MRWVAGCLVLAATGGGLGCGTGALPSDEVTLPDALTCAQTSWNVVHNFGVGSAVPSNLVLRDGTVYVSIWETGIVAVPTGGGEPVVLTTETGSHLWLEGDSLYFAKIEDKLRQVPLTGGTPAVVVQGLTSLVGPGAPTAGATALDATYFYWDLSPQNGPPSYTVWRAARAGGAAEKLADLPSRDPPYSARQLTVTPDALLIAINTQNVAYTVPLGGGSVQTLPLPPAPAPGTSNALVGSSAAGVLWMNEAWPLDKPYTMTRLSLSDFRAPETAPARPFWPQKPPYMRPAPMMSWSDGAGGWLVTGVETHADRKMHTSVWAVDAAGTGGTRLGCNPNAGSGWVWSTVATPEAVYAIVSYDDYKQVASQWLLVRIDRAPAAPIGA